MRPQCLTSDSTLTTHSFRHPDLLRRCFLALTSLTSLEWLLSKVQEQLPRSRSGVVRVKHTNLFYLFKATYTQPSPGSFQMLLYSLAAVMTCCFPPPTPECHGTLWHRGQTAFRDNHGERKCYNTPPVSRDCTAARGKIIYSRTANLDLAPRKGNV